MRLFHYTSLQAAEQIIPSGLLRATEIHYLNDAAELSHAVSRFRAALQSLSTSYHDHTRLLSQLHTWLSERISNGNWLFVVCFTEQGDLLSQWRGYTPHGQGVSIGFGIDHLLSRATDQQYEFGKCIYETHKQTALAEHAMRAVLSHAKQKGPVPTSEAHPSQAYFPAFQECETTLLRIAALMKHDAFEAEHEWRAVSKAVTEFRGQNVQYRAGRSTMVPYVHFFLKREGEPEMGIEEAIHGPTPHQNLAVAALSNFLIRYSVFCGGRRVSASRVPYRET